jgi:NADPH2:quinone reductase
MPFVPGTEGVGVVVAVGAEVTDIAPGDRVAYRSASGTYAQECLVQADHAIAVPDDIDDLQVAAILSKGLSAWCLLFKARPIAAGDTSSITAPRAAWGISHADGPGRSARA